jgi:hypothetical protein
MIHCCGGVYTCGISEMALSEFVTQIGRNCTGRGTNREKKLREGGI